MIALPHAGAQGVQASGQVGRAAALPEVVRDAAGETQGGESAAQTWGQARGSQSWFHWVPRAGSTAGRGEVNGPRCPGEGPRGNEGSQRGWFRSCEVGFGGGARATMGKVESTRGEVEGRGGAWKR